MQGLSESNCDELYTISPQTLKMSIEQNNHMPLIFGTLITPFLSLRVEDFPCQF